jgi:hypothetical protein
MKKTETRPLVLTGGPLNGATVYLSKGIDGTLTFTCKGQRGSYNDAGIWRKA